MPGTQHYDLRVAGAAGDFLFDVDSDGKPVPSSILVAVGEEAYAFLLSQVDYVTIDPGEFAGEYAIGGGPSGFFSGPADFDLNEGEYTLSLNGIGGFTFTVDANGFVTTTSAAAQTEGNTLTLNNSTVHVDPGAFAGEYVVGWVGASRVAGPAAAEFVVVPGIGQYAVSLNGIGHFPFDVAANGDVATESPAALAEGNTLTLNNSTVHVEPGAFAGEYLVNWVGASRVAGPASAEFVVVPGIGHYSVSLNGIGHFPFDVAANGDVTTDSGAALAAGTTLTLNNTTIRVDPDDYPGEYQVSWIGASFAQGPALGDFLVVPDVGHYSLTLRNVGNFDFYVDVNGDPVPSSIDVTVAPDTASTYRAVPTI